MNHVVTIRQQMEEARDQTLRLCTRVNDVDLRRQIHREFSPIGWHLGHIGVTEAYWILQQCKREPTLSAAYDRFFTPTDTPKPVRVHLPARDEILAYLHTVREQVLNFLASADCDSDHPLLRDARIFNMLLQHEEQHQETMSLILRLLAADRYEKERPFRFQSCRRPPHPGPFDFAQDRPLPRGEKETTLLADDNMTLVPAGSFVM